MWIDCGLIVESEDGQWAFRCLQRRGHPASVGHCGPFIRRPGMEA